MKMYHKKYLYMIFTALFISVAIIVIPSHNSQAATIQNKEVNDKKLCFTFEIPKNWTLLKETSKRMLFGRENYKDKNRKLVVIINNVEPLSKVAVEISVASIKKPCNTSDVNISHLKKLNQGWKEIGGSKKGYLISWSYSKKTVNYLKTVIVFKTGYTQNGNGLVSLTLLTKGSAEKEHNEFMQQIINSIRFK